MLNNAKGNRMCDHFQYKSKHLKVWKVTTGQAFIATLLFDLSMSALPTAILHEG